MPGIRATDRACMARGKRKSPPARSASSGCGRGRAVSAPPCDRGSTAVRALAAGACAECSPGHELPTRGGTVRRAACRRHGGRFPAGAGMGLGLNCAHPGPGLEGAPGIAWRPVRMKIPAVVRVRNSPCLAQSVGINLTVPGRGSCTGCGFLQRRASPLAPAQESRGSSQRSESSDPSLDPLSITVTKKAGPVPGGRS